MSEKLLELRKLRVAFNEKPAVDSIDLDIARAETLVLLGESGSGKSITALSIMRLLPAAAQITGGEVLLDGEDLLGLPESAMRRYRGARMAMIFQEPASALNPVLSAGQQIGETLRYHKGLGGRAQRERSIELLEAVGIPQPARRIHDYPHQFSGGMKQRIMIAMALAAEPDLLIADEPTTALDVTIQAQVLVLLRQLQEQSGMALLFITHDLGVAAQLADRIAVMREGQIVEQQGRAALLAAPGHAYTRSLLQAIPGWEKRRRDGVDAPAPASSVPGPAGSDGSNGSDGKAAGQGAEPLLSVTDLKVHFPIKKGLFKRLVGHVQAVDGVSFSLDAGQTLALVGESGSGKTTTSKGILSLLQITAGQVCHAGSDLAGLSRRQLRRRRRDIQVVFQDPYASMNPRMMISDIIQEGMIAQDMGGSPGERQQRVDALLQQVGLLPEHKHRYPHEFSGGQRQRICIARALAVQPSLIICDEPTSSLDTSVQAQILKLLVSLQQQFSLSYLLITHNIGVVEYMAHRVAVMYQGRIVEQGPVATVLQQPQHDYTRRLLAAVPRIGESSGSDTEGGGALAGF